MSNSKNVISWRRRTKQRMVSAFNGVCCVCGKEYPQEVMEFHHLVPEDKAFGLGSIRSGCISWKKIVVELRKCVMCCANCHRLIEYGHTEIPKNAPKFDEKYTDYKLVEKKLKYNRCRCGKEKLKTKKYCSTKCAALYSRKVKWPSKQKLNGLLRKHSLNQIGKMYGVSHAAVKKWKKKYNL